MIKITFSKQHRQLDGRKHPNELSQSSPKIHTHKPPKVITNRTNGIPIIKKIGIKTIFKSVGTCKIIAIFYNQHGIIIKLWNQLLRLKPQTQHHSYPHTAQSMSAHPPLFSKIVLHFGHLCIFFMPALAQALNYYSLL